MGECQQATLQKYYGKDEAATHLALVGSSYTLSRATHVVSCSEAAFAARFWS